MNKTYLILGIMTFLLLISCKDEKSSTGKQNEKREHVRVETTIAQLAGKSEVFNYSGVITPLINTPLSFQLPGLISAIYVDEGDQVKKGQVLAEIDKISSESSYQAARAMQKQAQDAYERLKVVYDKGSLPEIQWEEIKSKLEQANSAAQIAKQNLIRCFLVAPSDGVVGSRDIEVGSSAIPGMSVIDLVSIDEVYVRISVPENEINKIKKGQIAQVKIGAIGDSLFWGKVEKIGVVANQISKTYEVKLRIDNKNLSIRPGMVCDVNLTIPSESQAVVLPIQAILKDIKGNKYVYVVNKQTSQVRKVVVEVGEIIQNKVQILKGISVGELVVVNGQHKLNGQDYVVFD